MTKQFTTEQMATLKGFERYFDQAIHARFCSYPGRQNIETMLALWNEATDSRRTLRMGCNDCLFNLVADLGTLYFAQLSLQTAEQQAPQEQAKAPQVRMPKPSDYKTAEGFAKAYVGKYALAHPDEAVDQADLTASAIKTWNTYKANKAKKARK